VRADRGACLLCERSNRPLAPFALASIIQAALVPLSIGLMAASALIVAQAADRNWAAVILTLAVAALAYATRLNPLFLLLAGGFLGFAGVV